MCLKNTNRRPFKSYLRQLLLLILIPAIIILIAITTTVSVLTGEWNAPLSLILTTFGLLLGLSELVLKVVFSPSKDHREHDVPVRGSIILPATLKEYNNFRERVKARLVGTDVGALIVYANKATVGCQIGIFRKISDDLGFVTQFKVQPLPLRTYENGYSGLRTEYVAQQQFGNHSLYAAVFYDLPPATYHVKIISKIEFSELETDVVVVNRGQVTQLDWRKVRDNL